jgi:hypothetical protein
MKKYSLLIAVILALLSATVVLASGTLTDDAYTTNASGQTNIAHNGSGYLSVRSSGIGCAVNDEVFLQWDVSNIQAEVSSSTTTSALRIEKIFNSGSGANGNLEIWSTSDGWDETTITHDNKPGPSALLASISLPQADGVLSFSSANLDAYLNQQTAWVGGNDTIAGDNIASFIIRIGGCTNPSNQIFLSERGGIYGTPPSLDLYNPTAITLQAIRASSEPSGKIFGWLGLIASLALVLGAVVIYRRWVHQS